MKNSIPALDHGVVPVFRVALQILPRDLPGGLDLAGDLSRMYGSLGMAHHLADSTLREVSTGRRRR
jgi:hypothetical protein